MRTQVIVPALILTLLLVGSAAAATAEIEPRDNPIFAADAALECVYECTSTLASGLTEGPAVAPDGSIYFTDMPFGPQHDTIINRFDPASVHTAGALPASVAYDAAKWGMIGMTKSLAIELADRNLRFNAVSPGLVATQIWEDVKNAAPSHEACEAYFGSNIPIGRPIDPEEVADLVAFLLSDRSRAIVGSNLFIDGGMSSKLLSRPPFEFRQI